ncbi:MAG: hypothetical protein KC643_22420 [Nitrospira sp.]|nr:hypothetical protein [Nitrospira sp.]
MILQIPMLCHQVVLFELNLTLAKLKVRAFSYSDRSSTCIREPFHAQLPSRILFPIAFDRIMDHYQPRPIDTDSVLLPDELLELTEKLAENSHDHWAKLRMEQGWTWGEERNDSKKTHPDLVPYQDLPESEKDYDRRTAMETLKAILALGYTINKKSINLPSQA